MVRRHQVQVLDDWLVCYPSVRLSYYNSLGFGSDKTMLRYELPWLRNGAMVRVRVK